MKYSFSVIGAPLTGCRIAIALNTKLDAKMPSEKTKNAVYGVIMPGFGAAAAKSKSMARAMKR